MRRPRPDSTSPGCPCGCVVVGAKLTKYGHVQGCICRRCIGLRSKRKGQRGQRSVHRALGGVGFTPSNEESARVYEIEVLRVLPEVKAGSQVLKSFVSFVASEWFRKAYSQSERAVPIGSGARPALALAPEGGGLWLVVKVG